ncbi:MAG TPA: bifunctional phosphoribosylaminoimidazolecarboxamide formyltransferase/IMP cyclohydrolase [Acidimicrobiales bacterium]|nr:bifunctional phosphoribosylaminoimidazolecarboxamide formyltransferase/IMP cyclohydrolase [Acidimicrobiales bacterium]
MRALLSVYDKSGLTAFAAGLVDLGWEIVSSGGTSRSLSDAGIAHREVADVTGAPEMLDGRVKTLHPGIHGGILADRSRPSHLEDLSAQGIEPIDLVVCNLYPFAAQPSIEMIDVGGPTMVRAAAKNHDHVAVVVDPADYGEVLDELRREGAIGDATRRRLARAAFAHTAAYDAAIVGWFDSGGPGRAPAEVLPPTIHLTLERSASLRYGENPHQHGARYRVAGAPPEWLDGAVQHGGRELSYLNVFDADAAWRLLHEVVGIGGAPAAAVIVKHANPCGVALADRGDVAYERAFACDPISAFGGIVALSEPVDLALAEVIVANALADVLVAPAISDEAVALFAARRKNMRTLSAPAPGPIRVALRQVGGAMLVQDPDRFLAAPESWRVATALSPTPEQWADVRLAWTVCARTSSNAIVLARDGQVFGVGCGQQNRVDAASLATRKAGGRATGGVGASDAFFPFRDGLDAVVDSGVSVVVQPGGSLRDDEVVAAADERGIAMVMTGERHFRH